MGRHSVWELVFLMVILKIPIVYLCFVVYYAIKATPRPEEGAEVTARYGPDSGPFFRGRPARRPRGLRQTGDERRRSHRLAPVRDGRRLPRRARDLHRPDRARVASAPPHPA